MRLLITGGAGTLGLQIIEKYKDIAESIHVIDNFATGKRDIFQYYPELNVIEGSIGSEKLVNQLFKVSEPTHVIHLAASYKDPSNWQEDITTNISGTAIITRLSQQFGIKKLINIQTVLCYGTPDSLPIKINSALRPGSSYSISKVAGEQYIINSGIPYASLRLGNVISPGLAIGPIPNFYEKLKKGETPTVTESKRDFLDIADFLSALEKVINLSSPSGVFNISTGVGTSMMQIYEMVSEYLNSQVLPKKSKPSEDDISELVLDPSESFKLLDWKASVEIGQSIKSCLDYYEKFGVGTIYSHLKRSTN
jgi:UDP-glucose 4-epimerase